MAGDGGAGSGRFLGWGNGRCEVLGGGGKGWGLVRSRGLER